MVPAVPELLQSLWSSFLVLAPMLLLGLFLAGLIHVLISRSAVLRLLSGESMKSVCTSAGIGVPIPLCSCSVVPVVAEMSRKGASRSSCMSFLITAPETGADSILVTHAFFGPVAAIVRPVISFVTAVVTGLFCIRLVKGNGPADGKEHSLDEPCAHDHCDPEHGHQHEHDDHIPLQASANDCYVSLSQLRGLLADSLRTLAARIVPGMTAAGRAPRTAAPDHSQDAPEVAQGTRSASQAGGRADDQLTLGKVLKHVFRYGFVDLADEILLALLVGVALGGVLFLAIPDGLMENESARWLSYPLMVIVGVPLYICASASTPIAAALVAKGLSPGAALIFLMTGPATNSGTIALILSQFGTRFASVYVGGVIAVTVLLGVATDAVVLAMGATIPVNLSASDSPAIQFVEWTGALALIGLIAWRFQAGALRRGLKDLSSNLVHLGRMLRRTART